jgi:Flp pilus assembly protein TadD
MGRTRTKTKKTPQIIDGSHASESSKQTSNAKSTTPPIDALLAKAQELLVQCDYKLASKFVDRVLQRSPHHPEAKEMLGVIQLETGDLDSARQVCSLVQLTAEVVQNLSICRHLNHYFPRMRMHRQIPRLQPISISLNSLTMKTHCSRSNITVLPLTFFLPS